MVQRHLLDPMDTSGINKISASNLSLVCWEWCWRLRPTLFQSLRIGSSADSRTLYHILNKQVSGWLRGHVIAIVFADGCCPTDPISRALLRALPGLRHLQVLSAASLPCFLPRTGHLKSALHSLHSLQLRNCVFPSLSSILRVLGDIRSLQSLSLEHARWDGSDRSETAVALCNADFRNIKHIEMVNCTSNMELPSWILSAAVTGFEHTRRRDPQFGAPFMSDISMITTCLRMLGTHAVQGVTFDRQEIEGTVTLSYG